VAVRNYKTLFMLRPPCTKQMWISSATVDRDTSSMCTQNMNRGHVKPKCVYGVIAALYLTHVNVSFYRVIKKEVYTFKNLFYKCY
jgi:hypothetical protein